ncbi:MAG: ATP-binding protein [Capnocytophaga sp.]|nr:ATP-binding protein [Capnocytophaga sp.]
MQNPKRITPLVGRISLIISLLSGVFIGFFIWKIHSEMLWFVPIFCLILYFLCFFILLAQIKRFLHKESVSVYKEFSENFSTKTDFFSLKSEISRFAQNKNNEIEDLKIREDYRKEFIGNVSHELNTPLFTLQSYILTLLDGAMEDKNICKKYLQRAAKNVERLIFVVKDLEMISKLEAGELLLEYSHFDVVELINSTFELFEIRAKKRNITLTLDKNYQPIIVFADRERIGQVLANIILNSIKYGKENGTTEVAIENLHHNKIIIRITDNGEGVAKENLHRLFERFYRVDKSGSRKQGGSGLGLSIVKYVIEAHNETIFVESSLGIGSEFSFTLQKGKI